MTGDCPGTALPSAIEDGYLRESDVEEEVSSLPLWWRRNIEEFEEHSLKPYRPPRFSDGVLSPQLLMHLEDRLDCSISITAYNPQGDSSWNVVIDGTPAFEIPKERVSDGYTVYGITAGEFLEWVANAIDEPLCDR